MKPQAQALGVVLKAATFSAHKHRDQWRKDVKATPYINHPLALAQALCEEGAVDDPVILAATQQVRSANPRLAVRFDRAYVHGPKS